MWPFVNAEQWAAYMASQGYDPAQLPSSWQEEINKAEATVCEICGGELSPDKLYLLLDPPPGLVFGKKFHSDCLISHFYLHATDLSDPILNYAFRTKIAP